MVGMKQYSVYYFIQYFVQHCRMWQIIKYVRTNNVPFIPFGFIVEVPKQVKDKVSSLSLLHVNVIV